MTKFLKKSWKKLCVYTVIPFCLIVVALSWKFDAELKNVNKLRAKEEIEALKGFEATLKAKEKSRRTRDYDEWKMVDMRDAAIYSAYLETRPEVVVEETFHHNYDNVTWALIRIIGILEVGSESSDITCRYKFAGGTEGRRGLVSEAPAVGARVLASSENFQMRYSAAFVLCRLVRAGDGRLPLQITFSSRESSEPNKESRELGFVDVQYPAAWSGGSESGAAEEGFMSVCVPSLHHEYGNHENLVEFVEFYRMLGVSHFTFYNTSVSSKVSRLLEHYRDEGLARILHWKLPALYKFERNLRYNGIFAALNDCVYRNTMAGYTYVVNVDLDEFIVPRLHRDFREMMAYLDPISKEGSNEAAFIFRNVFFYLMYDDDPTTFNLTDVPKLMLQAKTTRYEEIYSAYSRSKYIARGENVIEMGNHRVWQTRKTSFLFRTGVTIVDPEVALSHHYRFCEVNELVCWLRETVVDTAAHKYTGRLRQRVAAVYKQVFPEYQDNKH